MGIRRRKSDQSEMNYLVSTSDLMAGLLFIFIIALALQSISFNEEEHRAIVAEQAARDAEAKARQAEMEARVARLEAKKAELKAVEIQNRLAGNDVARRDLLVRMQTKLAEEEALSSSRP